MDTNPSLPRLPSLDARHGGAREVLTAALLGLGLMAMTIVWWWSAMR
jgi:hypothetical protein